MVEEYEVEQHIKKQMQEIEERERQISKSKTMQPPKSNQK